MAYSSRLLSLVALSCLFLGACDSGGDSLPQAPTPVAVTVVDDAGIRARVEAAIANASDLPAGFIVEVEGGVVSISGSVTCEECGGSSTPGTVGTVQQSLGAIVRAVPGVERVEFDLSYGSD